GKRLRRLVLPNVDPDWLFLSPRGKTLAALGEERRCVFVWDVATGRRQRIPLAHESPSVLLKFSPDERLILAVTEDEQAETQTLHLWEAATGKDKLARSMAHRFADFPRPPIGPDRVTFSPDSRSFALCSGTSLSLYDTATGKQLRRW